jgi:hypothetical protein
MRDTSAPVAVPRLRRWLRRIASVLSADAPARTAARIAAPPPTLIPDARHLTMISDPDRVPAAIGSLTR